MAYSVQTMPLVRDYLRSLPGLSREARLRLFVGYFDLVANHADEHLAQSPLTPGSSCFRFDYHLLDGETAHSFVFVVEAAAARYGVMQVVYVEHSTGSIS
jgi:hypothetical protein